MRPEDLKLVTNKDDSNQCFPAKIVKKQYQGATTHYLVPLSDNFIINVEASGDNHDRFPIGQDIALAIDPLVVSIIFIHYPLLNILTASFGSDGQNGWVQLLHDNKGIAAFGNTLILATIVNFTSCLIGVPLAYVTARYSFREKAILELLPLICFIACIIRVATQMLLINSIWVIADLRIAPCPRYCRYQNRLK